MTGALGAQVHAPALFTEDEQLANLALAEIRQAWLDYHLIVFRDLSLDAPALARFCAQFGELDIYPFMQATPEHPNVIPVIKEAADTKNFGGAWHTDTSYLAQPPKATCLYALEVPASGGDTLFANTAMAYDALSPGMQNILDGLEGWYTPSLVHSDQGPYADVRSDRPTEASPSFASKDRLVDQRVRHPIVRRHPESGRQSIYATPLHCESFVEMTREETLPLLNYIYEFATRDEFLTRLQWQVGTLAIWDNRSLFHNALNDYQGQRREMYRVTLKGDTPQL